MSKLSRRRLPLLTQINQFFLTASFAFLHVILRPTSLEPAIAACCLGNLFGVIVPPLCLAGCCLWFLVKPLVDLLHPQAFDVIFVQHKLAWAALILVWNAWVALTDRCHADIEGAKYRFPRNGMERAAEQFWAAADKYVEMTLEPTEVVLPPGRQYLFAIHPHGIHCLPVGLFHRKGTPFDRRFPGICGDNLIGLTASVMFRLPGVRELFLTLPYIDASRPVAQKALHAGKSLFICTGSGEESLLTSPGEDIFLLSRRKGFVRLAMAYGCDLVPVLGLGNSDLFATYSIGLELRMWLQKRFHIAIPIFHGRYGTPLPYKLPIRIVVGEPMILPKPKNRGEVPDDAQVEQYLKKYIEHVKDLHKQYAQGRKLTIL